MPRQAGEPAGPDCPTQPLLPLQGQAGGSGVSPLKARPPDVILPTRLCWAAPGVACIEIRTVPGSDPPPCAPALQINVVLGPSSFQLAVCWLLSLWAFISRSENEDNSTWVVQTHVQQYDFTVSIVFLAFPMLCIPSQESSALSAWGLPATLGTPLGQREGPRTQRQHPSTSCSSRHPPTTTQQWSQERTRGKPDLPLLGAESVETTWGDWTTHPQTLQ